MCCLPSFRLSLACTVIFATAVRRGDTHTRCHPFDVLYEHSLSSDLDQSGRLQFTQIHGDRLARGTNDARQILMGQFERDFDALGGCLSVLFQQFQQQMD